MELTEKQVENYLKDQVERRGGLCIKLSPIFFRGIMDRLVILPGPIIAFAETKRTGGKARDLQDAVARRFIALGCAVKTLNSKEDVDIFIQTLRGTPEPWSLLSNRVKAADVEQTINRVHVCPCCGDRALTVVSFERIADGLHDVEYCVEYKCVRCGFCRTETRDPFKELVSDVQNCDLLKKDIPLRRKKKNLC